MKLFSLVFLGLFFAFAKADDMSPEENLNPSPGDLVENGQYRESGNAFLWRCFA